MGKGLKQTLMQPDKETRKTTYEHKNCLHGSQGHYTYGRSQPPKGDTMRLHLHNVLEMAKYRGKQRSVAARGTGRARSRGSGRPRRGQSCTPTGAGWTPVSAAAETQTHVKTAEGRAGSFVCLVGRTPTLTSRL